MTTLLILFAWLLEGMDFVPLITAIWSNSEGTLNVLFMIAEYFADNYLSINPSKMQVEIFHLRNQDANVNSTSACKG